MSHNESLFPLPNNPLAFHHDTLIDGELVCSQPHPATEGDQQPLQNPKWTYVAYDLIAINGTSVVQRSFSTRLGILQQDVIKPHHALLQRRPDLAAKSPFSIELKRQERSYGLGAILSNSTAQGASTNGLIFTPVRSPYIPGYNNNPVKLLKWVPPENNTISFKIKIVWDKERKPHYQIMNSNYKAHVYFDDISLEPELAQAWRQAPPDGRIADFRYDETWKTCIWEHGYTAKVREGGWRFVRFRDDRDSAHNDKILGEKWPSIKDKVTREMLESHVETIRLHWKAREKQGATTTGLEQRSHGEDHTHSSATSQHNLHRDDNDVYLRRASASSVDVHAGIHTHTDPRRTSIASIGDTSHGEDASGSLIPHHDHDTGDGTRKTPDTVLRNRRGSEVEPVPASELMPDTTHVSSRGHAGAQTISLHTSVDRPGSGRAGSSHVTSPVMSSVAPEPPQKRLRHSVSPDSPQISHQSNQPHMSQHQYDQSSYINTNVLSNTVSGRLQTTSHHITHASMIVSRRGQSGNVHTSTLSSPVVSSHGSVRDRFDHVSGIVVDDIDKATRRNPKDAVDAKPEMENGEEEVIEEEEEEIGGGYIPQTVQRPHMIPQQLDTIHETSHDGKRGVLVSTTIGGGGGGFVTTALDMAAVAAKGGPIRLATAVIDTTTTITTTTISKPTSMNVSPVIPTIHIPTQPIVLARHGHDNNDNDNDYDYDNDIESPLSDVAEERYTLPHTYDYHQHHHAGTDNVNIPNTSTTPSIHVSDTSATHAPSRTSWLALVLNTDDHDDVDVIS